MWKKAMVYLGLQDDEEFDRQYDEYDPYEEYTDGEEDEQALVPASRERKVRNHETPTVRPISRETPMVMPSRPGVVRTMPSSGSQVHVVEPQGFNDAQELGDCLRVNQPVILNLQGLSKELQRRLIDFSSGITYACGGAMSRVADQVFLLTPSNVEVSDEEKERLSARGLFHR